MSILTFKGGVHPYDGKELAKDVAVRKILPKGEVVIPLSQHIGAPATPIVEAGQRVLKGELIAESSGFISANIHSNLAASSNMRLGALPGQVTDKVFTEKTQEQK